MKRATHGSYQVLYRYISKEFILSFLVAFAFFFFIFFINQILLYAQKILIKQVPIQSMLTLVALSMPQILLYTIPFSTLSASSMVIGDLSANNEIIALRAGGISLAKMFKSILFIALFLVMVTYSIADFLIPYTNIKFKQLYSTLLQEIPTLEVESYAINTIGDISVITGEVNDGLIHNLIVFDTSNSDEKQIIKASEGTLQLVDISAFIYRLDLYNVQLLTNSKTSTQQFSYANGKKMTYYLDFSSELHQINDLTPSKMNSKELMVQINKRLEDLRKVQVQREEKIQELEEEILKLSSETEIQNLTKEINRIQENQPINFYLQYYRAELHKKLALSLSCLILALISFPISFLKIKHGRLFGFGLSLLVAALYWALLFVAQSQIIRYPFHPAFLIWAPNMIIAIVTLLLFTFMRRL
jgi:lipopolysaccharide export system permease protein